MNNSFSLQTKLQQEITLYTKKILINEIVKSIHEEWIKKIRLAGKITKRETNELEKRLKAHGFTATFEKGYNCFYCQISINNNMIEWFNLYDNLSSLQNTVETITGQVKVYQQSVAQLVKEVNESERLGKVEIDAAELMVTITSLLKDFFERSKFDSLTMTTRKELPATSLLAQTLKNLS